VDRQPRRVLGRLTGDLQAGEILVLHDGSSPRLAGGRPLVTETLPPLLDALAERGLSAVALPPPAGGRR
ncbi:MAG TPA: polysaccharide deacetylase family protein, partial [Thermoanaerobaculia bacterium]|nr:polysaccharide deacetylase family protein [Thermoanaerobaculia bacterium]